MIKTIKFRIFLFFLVFILFNHSVFSEIYYEESYDAIEDKDILFNDNKNLATLISGQFYNFTTETTCYIYAYDSSGSISTDYVLDHTGQNYMYSILAFDAGFPTGSETSGYFCSFYDNQILDFNNKFFNVSGIQYRSGANAETDSALLFYNVGLECIFGIITSGSDLPYGLSCSNTCQLSSLTDHDFYHNDGTSNMHIFNFSSQDILDNCGIDNAEISLVFNYGFWIEHKVSGGETYYSKLDDFEIFEYDDFTSNNSLPYWNFSQTTDLICLDSPNGVANFYYNITYNDLENNSPLYANTYQEDSVYRQDYIMDFDTNEYTSIVDLALSNLWILDRFHYCYVQFNPSLCTGLSSDFKPEYYEFNQPYSIEFTGNVSWKDNFFYGIEPNDKSDYCMYYDYSDFTAFDWYLGYNADLCNQNFAIVNYADFIYDIGLQFSIFPETNSQIEFTQSTFNSDLDLDTFILNRSSTNLFIYNKSDLSQIANTTSDYFYIRYFYEFATSNSLIFEIYSSERVLLKNISYTSIEPRVLNIHFFPKRGHIGFNDIVFFDGFPSLDNSTWRSNKPEPIEFYTTGYQQYCLWVTDTYHTTNFSNFKCTPLYVRSYEDCNDIVTDDVNLLVDIGDDFFGGIIEQLGFKDLFIQYYWVGFALIFLIFFVGSRFHLKNSLMITSFISIFLSIWNIGNFSTLIVSIIILAFTLIGDVTNLIT